MRTQCANDENDNNVVDCGRVPIVSATRIACSAIDSSLKNGNCIKCLLLGRGRKSNSADFVCFIISGNQALIEWHRYPPDTPYFGYEISGLSRTAKGNLSVWEQ